MIRFLTTAVIAASIALPLAAEAAKPDAFVRNIQHELNLYGFKDVDASQLSKHQLGALHLKLSNSVGLFGYEGIRRKQEIKVILGWDK